MKKDCRICGVMFVVNERRQNAKFCSRECYYYAIKQKREMVEKQQQQKAAKNPEEEVSHIHIGTAEFALLLGLMAILGIVIILTST